jgi:hypothetical protein
MVVLEGKNFHSLMVKITGSVYMSDYQLDFLALCQGGNAQGGSLDGQWSLQR